MTSTEKRHAGTGRWRIDFSLALFNRSGKFQIGQEIIAHNRDLIDSVWYWRHAASAPPTGWQARLLGKGEKIERDLRIALGDRRARRVQGKFRWLHVDPLTVCHRRPGAGDVVLVHDMGPLTHPGLFPAGTERAYDFAFRIASDSGAELVFVSRTSRDQFVRIYGEPAHARVIYPPVAPRLRNSARQQPQDIADRYLLTVGAMGRRKNQARCIEAFAASGLAAQGVEYVLCGSREPGHEDVTALAARTPGVRVLSFVSDEELRWLYAHAAGFVLVSQLEGFGMPVAEAMAFGLVPIISRDSVLEEVAGAAAIAVSPTDTAEIAAAMQRTVGLNEGERVARRTAMDGRLALFSDEVFNTDWRDLLSHA